jgi:hypothetical protein
LATAGVFSAIQCFQLSHGRIRILGR